ncbi:hypothetical protein [Chitinophaga pinensis]|uniref:Uncharacterized protein n=1 Tax=Chitinophaga pinensis (strain ATCC 43595 / DSM 2588 / LMG 13176 / NBRC 15968 / NCIMB 11800 / UQM 2034) TaxID=485918 RepID=A0A979GXR3_CHIPD|nr:hypothetical protein [Chitinophaga pinensis]ACU61355.1 hypothetical protein Cpin_3893 [Chitinophaga pinensis DSM 2588]
MKVKIKKRFRDIESKEIMQIGQVVDYDKERAVSLSLGGFVEILDQAAEPEDTQPGETSGPSDNAIHDDNDDTVESEEDTEKPDVNPDIEKFETSHIPKAETAHPTGKGRGAKKK